MKQAHTTNKITYLEGLRGLASLIVVFHHYACGFFPATIFGDDRLVHNAWEMDLYKTPVNLFLAGNFAVCIFFILSGYVLSYKFIVSGHYSDLVSGSLRRYLRLFIPVFPTVFIAFCLMKLDLFFNLEASSITNSSWLSGWWHFKPKWFDMIYQGIYGVFINGDATYNGNLWTMKMEFLGSFIVFAFLALFGKVARRWIIYLVLIYIFLDSYFLGFVLGVLLCDLFHNRKVSDSFQTLNRKLLLFPLLAVGLFLGSYPMFNVKDTMYEFLQVEHIKLLNNYVFYHTVGSFFLLFVLLNSGVLKKFFSSKVMLYLGRISFSLYLIHLIVICSLSSYLFKLLIPHFSYNTSFVLMFIPSLLIILIGSTLYYKYVDLGGIKLAKITVTKWFLSDRSTASKSSERAQHSSLSS